MTDNMLQVGARIWRPARRKPGGGAGTFILETPSMQDFGDGTVMLRAKPAAETAPDWLVVPWEEGGGRVCVCDEAIPEDWTYFEVLFADVNFVAVSPVAGAVHRVE